ncbi:hypothetical protein KQR54_18200 [Mycobacterium gordonae]|nr:hypothetical protein [Mycobacterium gordonae]
MDMLFELNETNKGKELFSSLYPIVNSYYEESLALLRATRKLFDSIDKEEEQSQLQYSNLRSKLDELEPKDSSDYESYESYAVVASRLLERQRLFYMNIDLEKNLFSLGTVVQFLSLLESTLYSLYKALVEADNSLQEINTICKRDKGIVKYLKYFEKGLLSNADLILVGTSDYQKLHQWINFRNNIVHNNNDMKEELVLIIEQYKLPIYTRRKKFVFDNNNIDDLANICGSTLDLLIDKVLRPYFIKIGAVIE